MWSKMHYPHLKIILLLHIKATPGLDKKTKNTYLQSEM